MISWLFVNLPVGHLISSKGYIYWLNLQIRWDRYRSVILHVGAKVQRNMYIFFFNNKSLIYIYIYDGIPTAFSPKHRSQTDRFSASNWARRKPSFYYTSCLIRTLTMASYNPHITGSYNPLYTKKHQGLFIAQFKVAIFPSFCWSHLCWWDVFFVCLETRSFTSKQQWKLNLVVKYINIPCW